MEETPQPHAEVTAAATPQPVVAVLTRLPGDESPEPERPETQPAAAV